jgi:hypothetical protein
MEDGFQRTAGGPGVALSGSGIRPKVYALYNIIYIMRTIKSAVSGTDLGPFKTSCERSLACGCRCNGSDEDQRMRHPATGLLVRFKTSLAMDEVKGLMPLREYCAWPTTDAVPAA